MEQEQIVKRNNVNLPSNSLIHLGPAQYGQGTSTQSLWFNNQYGHCTCHPYVEPREGWPWVLGGNAHPTSIVTGHLAAGSLRAPPWRVSECRGCR